MVFDMAQNEQKFTIRICDAKFAQDVILEIGKFCVLWSIFENDKCDNDCNIEKLLSLENSISDIDPDKITRLAISLQGRVDMSLRGEELVGYIVEPEKAKRKMPAEKRTKMGQFLASDGQESLAGCLIAIYRIRNNMFHGLKRLESLNSQIELFRAMNGVLEELIR